jgi:hypothetical protein
VFKRHTKEKTLKVIFIYIVYCLINEILGYYLGRIQFSEIDIFFALFTLLEFIFFSLFYAYAIPSPFIKKIVYLTVGLFSIFSFTDFFLINKMNGFDSFNSGIECVLIILMCIYYLAVQIKGTDLFVYSTSNFWIIITFLIYSSGTFFLYIMAEPMMRTREFQIQYVIINAVFNILKNILLSIAMLMKESIPGDERGKKNKARDELLSYKLKT